MVQDDDDTFKIWDWGFRNSIKNTFQREANVKMAPTMLIHTLKHS